MATPLRPEQLPLGPFSGDTLELVSIGGRPLPDSRQTRLRCDSAATPAFEQMFFVNDSTYRGVSATRPGCRDERFASSDTTEWVSLYRLHGDTLTLYSGDGDETFEAYNGRVFPDSVVQVAIERERIHRYIRRRVTHR